jgi:hypothetical protein
VQAIEPINDFIDFPPKEEILARLRAVDESSQGLEELYQGIADRLAAKTYERSASAFILIEVMYDFEESHGADMSYLLPRYVLSLTGDRDLALSALGAFNEIKDAIRLQQPAEQPQAAPGARTARSEPAEERGRGPNGAIAVAASQPTPQPTPLPTPQPPPPTIPPPPEPVDQMMAKLQTAQKALADLGLSTRVSIDLASRRPGRERVSRTLQDIASLRGAMRRFEELLSEAELQVLEAAGVLWEEEIEERRGRRR